jgi:hypothetical protein
VIANPGLHNNLKQENPKNDEDEHTRHSFKR